jgi:hypothetical protein
MREYFENLYSSKLENLEEMHKFLDAFDLPKLNKKDTNLLNRYVTSNENASFLCCLSQQRKDKNLTESLLTFKEELISVLLKLYNKIERQ